MSELIDLTGKVALVTGGGSGIGRATALMLGRAGARVSVVDLIEERAASVADEAKALGYGVHAIAADVSRPADVERAVRETVERWGGLNVVVANAGISTKATVAEMDDATWDRMMAVNLDSVFYTARAAIPAMRAGEYGRIVCVASHVGVIGRETMAHYSATKAGIIGLVRSLALELAPEGITANAVAPGPVLTSISPRTPEYEESWRRQVPLGRMGEPEDVAGAILFLSSGLASWITGHVLHVNGGVFLQ